MLNIQMALLTFQRNKYFVLQLKLVVSSYNYMGMFGFFTIEMDILKKRLLLQNITSFANICKLL